MKRYRIFQLLAIVAVLCCSVAVSLAGEGSDAVVTVGRVPVYVGTYTRGASKGIYLYHLDLGSGALRPAGCVAEVANPSFLALHPRRPLMYAVGEVGNFAGKKGGVVSAFAIDQKTGKLNLLNQQSSQGSGPCHLMVDRSGRCVIVANYGGGSVACLPIQDDGQLGEATSFVQHEGSSMHPQRQQGPHAHGIEIDIANRFAFVVDLGLDKVMVYRLDANQGKLTANDPAWFSTAPGAGPRHLAFHPNGRWAYLIDELSSTMMALGYDAERGVLSPLQTISTLPEGFQGTNTCAEVAVHPSGKFVYGSNRGHDSIAAFAVDAESGKLRLLGNEPTQGRTPRNFAIDPSGKFLLAANQDGNNIVVLQINEATGELRATGNAVELASPVCVLMPRPRR